MAELIVTLDDAASTDIIGRAIRLLRGVKTVTVKKADTLSKIKATQLDELAKMQQLDDNWDGDHAMPISRHVIKNVRSIIMKSDDDTLAQWTIFPETNGTLLLQKNDYSACISVGEHDYTIVSPNLNKNHETFSTAALSRALQQIS